MLKRSCKEDSLGDSHQSGYASVGWDQENGDDLELKNSLGEHPMQKQKEIP